MVLDPDYAVSVTPQRPTSDSMGHTTWVDLSGIDVVVSLNAATPMREGDTHYAQTGAVFVPRGTDVRSGDRITYNGEHYVLYGQPRGDHAHPFTGDDFGWVQYAIHSGG